VTFTADLEEDLKRRDFTINAMAYNEQTGLVDLYGGLQDIDRGMIRCVGEARERFTEDALRMLRAVRFSAQLGYQIERDTKKAIQELSPSLRRISAERIQAELVKLVVSDHPDYLRTAYETGITAQFFPEFDLCMETKQNNPHHCYHVGEHILHSMMQVEPDKILRLGMLFHDIGKPQTLTVDAEGITHNKRHAEVGEQMTMQILRRLKFDNGTITNVVNLVRWHDIRYEAEPAAVRRMLSVTGREMFPLYMEVQRADVLSQSEYRREEKLTKLSMIQRFYEETLSAGYCTSLRELAVTGRDLTARGISAGPELGKMLKSWLELVLEEPKKNTKKELLGFLGL